MNRKMKKILLDTDIGCDIDDALALTYLLKNPECELLGITTVSGDVQLRAKICSMICRHENNTVSIRTGEKTSLKNIREAEFPQQSERLCMYPHNTEFEGDAVGFMKDIIEKNPGQVTLLAIGPLTNIAKLFIKHPDTARKLEQIYIMGGKFFGEETLEWNIKFDPHAAKIVFETAVKKLTIIGLDVTLSFFLTRDEIYKKIVNAPILKQLSRDWFNNISDKIYFHDPLTTALIFNENLCDCITGTAYINMDTFCTVFKPGTGVHHIAANVNIKNFYSSFFDIINR